MGKEIMMKPVIKVWCLPHDQAEAAYIMLQLAIVSAVLELDIGISSQNDMTVLMPVDLMKKGLGEEIIVEINFAKSAQSGMLKPILSVVKELYPLAAVQGVLTFSKQDGTTMTLHLNI